MRVLVDTSAWVDFLNGFPSPAADALADLLRGDDDVCTCGIVAAEVFQGLRRERGRDAIRRSFEDMVFLEPSGMRLYLRAADLYRGLRERGRTIRSTIDCVVAAIAEEGGCRLLARDRDMDAILDSGLLKVERWQASSGR
ncbi:MAG TPA: PIN domain-containing protein [Vicinamibacteria bacterium]|nr:PIN domain-containing protein [Vicinamibacteria bacterium]